MQKEQGDKIWFLLEEYEIWKKSKKNGDGFKRVESKRREVGF